MLVLSYPSESPLFQGEIYHYPGYAKNTTYNQPWSPRWSVGSYSTESAIGHSTTKDGFKRRVSSFTFKKKTTTNIQHWHGLIPDINSTILAWESVSLHDPVHGIPGHSSPSIHLCIDVLKKQQIRKRRSCKGAKELIYHQQTTLNLNLSTYTHENGFIASEWRWLRCSTCLL